MRVRARVFPCALVYVDACMHAHTRTNTHEHARTHLSARDKVGLGAAASARNRKSLRLQPCVMLDLYIDLHISIYPSIYIHIRCKTSSLVSSWTDTAAEVIPSTRQKQQCLTTQQKTAPASCCVRLATRVLCACVRACVRACLRACLRACARM